MQLIVTIDDPAVIQEILAHLDLPMDAVVSAR
jgi:hypothetical protein